MRYASEQCLVVGAPVGSIVVYPSKPVDLGDCVELIRAHVVNRESSSLSESICQVRQDAEWCSILPDSVQSPNGGNAESAERGDHVCESWG